MLRRLKIFANDPRNSVRYNEANLQTRELLRRYYGQNHEFQQYLDHATGLAHNLATYNARVCTSATLRLYRVMEGRGRARRLDARPIPAKRMKQIRAGQHGRKIANFAENGAEMVEITTHPLLDLLNNPNPIYPGTLLEHLKWYMAFIGGNQFEYKSKHNGRPFMLSPLFPQWVSINSSIQRGVENYTYGRAGYTYEEFGPDEVIHYKLHPSPHDAMYGIGCMYGVLPHADLVLDSLLHDISMAKNGMHPDGIWLLPESTDGENAAKFEKQLKSKFRGARDWWKHLVFAGKVEFVSPQIPEKDLLSIPKQENAEKIIRQAFGHTESMADSTDTNVASAIQSHDKQFLGGTIWPALLNDASFKNAQLLPDFGLDPDLYCFSYDNPVERDEAMYANRLRADFMAGLITANEYRIEMGLPKSGDEHANTLLFNGQPLGQSPAAADPLAGLFGGMGGGNQGEREEPVGSSLSDEGAPSGEASPEAPDEPEGRSLPPLTVDAVLRGFAEPSRWKPCPICAKSQPEEEFALDRILREAMGDPAEALEAVLADILADASAAFISAYFLDGIEASVDEVKREFIDQASGEIREAMVPIVEFGGNEMLDALPATVEGGFQIADERAAEFLREYTIELAEDVLGTQAEIAKRAVTAGIEAGLNPDEVTQFMVEEGINENRARMIARTETQRAVQNGKRQAMLQAGIKQVEWTTAPGATPEHQEIARRSPKPIDEPFVKAGETIGREKFDRDIYVPPARPNCRCSILPVFED